MTTIEVVTDVKVIEQQRWFGKLEEDEQVKVLKESAGLMKEVGREGESRLKVGAHLLAVRKILEPRRCWLKYLRAFRFSQRTAYRYIVGYENAAKVVPAAVLKVAGERAVELISTGKRPLGVYTEAVEKIGPPPKNEKEINLWLERVVAVKKEMGKVTPDRDALQLTCVRMVKRAFSQLPSSSRVRGAWMREHIGICLGIAGMGAQTVSPVAFPEPKEKVMPVHVPTNGVDHGVAA